MLKKHGFMYLTDTVASDNKVLNGGTAIGNFFGSDSLSHYSNSG